MPPAAQLIVAAELARLWQERAVEIDAMPDGEAVFALGQLIVDAMAAARPRIQRLAIHDPARGMA